MDGTSRVAATDPGEAFGTLASEIRVTILRALWDADDQVVPFSDLQSAVDVEDSGKFNYHVGRFDGRFVERTDDGYRLTQAGVRLVGALIGGSYTSRDGTGPVAVEDACPACAGELTFEYADDHGLIDCESCGRLSEYPVPPGVLADRDEDELASAVQQYAHSVIERASRGFCPQCEGPTDSRLVTAATTADDASTPPRALEDIPMARSDCRRCGRSVDTTVRIRLVRHPAVVSFFHDRGVDYRDLSIWRLGGLDDDVASVTGRAPLEATVSYTADGDKLALIVDESLSVVAVDRQ